MYPSATVLRQNISRLIKDTEIQTLPVVEPVRNQSWKRQNRRENGRRERIRTSDPFVPNEVRYQAALHADQRPVLYGLPAVLLPPSVGKIIRTTAEPPFSLRLAAGKCRLPAGTGCAGG